MFKLRWLIILALVFATAQSSFADDRAKVVGLWRAVSFETEYQGTSEREAVLGKNPAGYIFYSPEGRMWSILTAEGRTSPTTDQDRSDLFKSMFAYTGTYRVEGDKLITKVDVSWNPAWLDTEQVRFFQVEGNLLKILSDWKQPVVRPERGLGRGITTYERVK